MKAHWICLVLLAVAAPAPASGDRARRPITHEDVWLMKQVGSPVPRPDGRLIVVPVTEPAYDECKKATDLWLVPADGSAPPRQLTFTASGESNPA